MNQLFRILLVCCLSGKAFGQLAGTALPLDAETRRITYAASVPAAGTSQAELLARAQAWARSHSPADKQPLLSASEQADVLLITGIEEMIYPRSEMLVRQPLRYTATLSVAEGRYEYRVTNFALEYAGAPTPRYESAEAALLQTPPTKAAATALYYVRTAFEEATAQLLGSLQTSLAPPAPASATR